MDFRMPIRFKLLAGDRLSADGLEMLGCDEWRARRFLGQLILREAGIQGANDGETEEA